MNLDKNTSKNKMYTIFIFFLIYAEGKNTNPFEDEPVVFVFPLRNLHSLSFALFLVSQFPEHVNLPFP